MMHLNLRNRHFFLLDGLLLCLTPVLALMLRLDTTNIPTEFVPALLVYTIIALVVRLVIFYWFGLYRRFWRYASIDELIQIGLAVLTATLFITLLFIVARAFYLFAFARSVLVLDGLLALIFVGGVRFSARISREWRRRLPADDSRRVVVMGAGDVGAMIVRELLNKPHLKLNPVGFLDDDRSKHHMRIHGVPVLGGRDQIALVMSTYEVDRVIIAMPTAPGEVIRQVVNTCEQVGVETKIVPAMYELLDGTVSVNQLRDVDIEDLLRREPVRTDVAAVNELISGQRVLITGAGGSIGGELCRQVLRCAPAELVLLGHGENSIFEIFHELRLLEPDGSPVTPLIADTRFPGRIRHIFEQYRPQIVFHAAAHKHVPLMEMNPAEAITNNVLGTRNVLKAALAVGVERFVMISTDKAVNPANIMGASKRAAELLVHRAAKESGRPFVAVRFGNVLGSRGSVLFTFKKQIAAGGPVTVTHPEMKRYFMTIPEAVQLVLQAAVLGQGSEVFVLDMGEPIKIVDLARDLIELSGLEVGRDIEIRFTGLRPGEKMFEEMFIPGEKYHRTRHEKIFIAGNAGSFVPEGLDAAIDALGVSAQRNDREAILRGLQNLAPEFRPGKNETERRGSPLAPGLPPIAAPTRAQPAHLAMGPWPDIATARSFLSRLTGPLPGNVGEANGQNERWLESVADMPALVEWLIGQGVGPLAYARYRADCPQLATCLQTDAFSAVAENSLHFNSLAQIESGFHAAAIPVVLLKGAALAEAAYGDPALRTMSDVDIWVREPDMPPAVAVMKSLGFQAHHGRDRRPLPLQRLSRGEIQFHRHYGEGVELHWSPFSGWWLRRTAVVDDAAIWSRIEPLAPDRPLRQLAAEDMVIHVAVHLAVNHQFGLAPVRSLLDIAATAQTRPVDWLVVAARAKRWRVGTAVWSVLNLLNQLIGVPGLEPALSRLCPSPLRRRLLGRFVSPESVLAGVDLRGGRARYLLLLLLVDRPQDALRLLYRTLWPEKAWLDVRYQGQESRWRHLWSVVCYGRV